MELLAIFLARNETSNVHDYIWFGVQFKNTFLYGYTDNVTICKSTKFAT